MNIRFLLLAIISSFLRIIGCLIIIGGIVIGAKFAHGVSACFPQCSMNLQWAADNAFLFAAVLVVLFGILIVVIGEILGVFLGIENNTHKAMKLIEKQYLEKAKS